MTISRLSARPISIHAPVKGATQAFADAYALAHISIHAPVKGATRSVREGFTAIRNFNPRSREGSDRPSPAVDTVTVSISIHAPVKGATDSNDDDEEDSIFQSTLP